MPPDLRDAPAPPRRRLLLALLTVAYGMGAFGILGVSPLLPSLVEGFRLTRLDVAFVVPSVYLGGLLFSLPAGHLADRWGVRPTLLGGLALGAAGLALAAAAPRFGVYLACIFLAGVGWSVVNPVLGKAIVDLFLAGERGVAMGIKQMGLTVGGVISALVLPPIAAAFGWRAAVVACAVVMGAPALASWRALASLAATRPGAGVSGGHRRARVGGHLLHRERRGRRAAPVRPAQRRGLHGDRGGPHAGGAAPRRGAGGARLLRGGVGGLRRLSALVALLMALAGGAIHRECERARGGA